MYFIHNERHVFRYGLECLFRFYTYGLEKHFRSEVFDDFQEETLRDHNAGKNETITFESHAYELFDYCQGQLYGLEKFWAFLKYSRNRPKINDKLDEILKNYKCLEDFRVDGASFPQQFYTTKTGIVVR
jgi:la-related protein 1